MTDTVHGTRATAGGSMPTAGTLRTSVHRGAFTPGGDDMVQAPTRLFDPATPAAGKSSGPEIVVRDLWVPPRLDRALRTWTPKTDLGRFVRECVRLLPAEMGAELIERFSKVVILQSALYGKVRWGKTGKVEDLGLLGDKVITNNGVAFLVDAWQNTVELEIMKYHGLGTGSTAEANADSALVTELTTEYTGNVRATGTLAEASAAVFETVGQNLLDGTPGAALREHGLFSASSAGVLWDRTVFAAITLSSGDQLDTTYDMTATAGG